MYKLGMHVHE